MRDPDTQTTEGEGEHGCEHGVPFGSACIDCDPLPAEAQVTHDDEFGNGGW